MVTIQELLAQQAALAKQASALAEQIENARRSERAAVLNQIKALMTEHGVSLAELSGNGKAGRGARAAKSSPAGRKVAAKFRDAETGNTWSGRGLQPNWLKAALQTGRQLQDFAV